MYTKPLHAFGARSCYFVTIYIEDPVYALSFSFIFGIMTLLPPEALGHLRHPVLLSLPLILHVDPLAPVRQKLFTIRLTRLKHNDIRTLWSPYQSRWMFLSPSRANLSRSLAALSLVMASLIFLSAVLIVISLHTFSRFLTHPLRAVSCCCSPGRAAFRSGL